MLTYIREKAFVIKRAVIQVDGAHTVLFIPHNTVLNDCGIMSAIRGDSPYEWSGLCGIDVSGTILQV